MRRSVTQRGALQLARMKAPDGQTVAVHCSSDEQCTAEVPERRRDVGGNDSAPRQVTFENERFVTKSSHVHLQQA